MIKIDMEMPKSCETCKFYDRFGCYISGHCFIDADKDQPRMINCPLIECENEKSCETCKYYEVLDGYRICNADECTNYSAWERK
jgi:hypothetical protein